jgi:hypothetical protein
MRRGGRRQTEQEETGNGKEDKDPKKEKGKGKKKRGKDTSTSSYRHIKYPEQPQRGGQKPCWKNLLVNMYKPDIIESIMYTLHIKNKKH